ncbi:Fc.00g086960.m01.CDS01 [Cosmosporella sp. VM-42]
MSTQTTGFNGLTAKGVPALPVWLLFVRIAIIVLSLGVLIASAYNLSLFGGYATSSYLSGYTGPPGFLIFDAIFTWIILGCMLVSEFFAPQLYFRLAFVGALILDAIFWLSAWAWAASVASDWISYYNNWGFGSDSGLDKYGSSMAAAAALGAFTWVLIIVTIVFFVLACLKSPQSSTFQERTPQNEAELGQAKFEPQPTVQPTPIYHQ